MIKYLYLLFPFICSAGVTPGNIPQGITPPFGTTTAISNSPLSVVNGTNISAIGNISGNIITGTNAINFSGTLNGIPSNIVQRIGGLISDAQTQITVNGDAITANTVNITANTASIATVAGNLVTASNRIETVNSLNVKLSGATMTGPLLVTSLTNSSLSANALVGSDGNKADISVGVGIGLTNNSGTLSNNIIAGSNVTITGGANGQLTIASTGGGGGGGTVGTLINTTATSAGQIVQFTSNSKTNTAPLTIGIGLTNNANVLSNNIIAGSNIGLVADANGQLTLSSFVSSNLVGFPALDLDVNGGTNVESVSSTAETIIYTNTLPAGILGTNRTLSLIIDNQYFNTSGGAATYTWRVYIGSTLSMVGASAAISSGTGIGQCTLDLVICGNGVNSQWLRLGNLVSGRNTLSLGNGSFAALSASGGGWGIASETSANALGIGVTVSNSVNNSGFSFKKIHASLFAR